MSRNRGKSVVLEIDANVAEATVRLADHIPSSLRDDFIQKTFSLLLCTLLRDKYDYHDDFEGLSTMATDGSVKDIHHKYAVLWGEWLQLKDAFFKLHVRQDVTIEVLEELAAGRREVPVLMFDVHYSQDGRTLTVR